MHARAMEFLNRNNYLSEMQYGFRSAPNLILDTHSKNEIPLLLLMDFLRALDMIEHEILLKKT